MGLQLARYRALAPSLQLMKTGTGSAICCIYATDETRIEHGHLFEARPPWRLKPSRPSQSPRQIPNGLSHRPGTGSHAATKAQQFLECREDSLLLLGFFGGNFAPGRNSGDFVEAIAPAAPLSW